MQGDRKSSLNMSWMLLKDIDNTSYLGVELSPDMKLNSHVKKVTTRGIEMLNILHRNLKNCPKNAMILSYKSLLMPKLDTHLPYGFSYCRQHLKTRSPMTIGTFCQHHDSVTSMMKDLDWPSLQQDEQKKDWHNFTTL